VLANDSDVDGDSLSVESVTQPTNGTAINNTTDVTYTPDADHCGIDSFSYVISDGVLTDTATVDVTVTCVNDAPVAADDTETTNEDTAVTVDVLANDSDVDGDSLSVESVTQPTNGTVINNTTDVTYTPDADHCGIDSFSYVVSDGVLTDTATVDVTVTCVNDAPVAADDTEATNEDTAVTVDVLDNDTDVDGDSLSIESVTQPANGTVTNNTTDVTYTPDADYCGSDSFTYTAADGNGGADVATVDVTVTCVNDTPVAADDTETTNEDTAVTVDVLANDSEVDGDSLRVESVTQPTNGTVINNTT
ncbi:MAG: tandem-95 repeat protein, partial [bacterium]|nr:tandem-95 repeat protein [bacterium]